ncbi:MAG: DUF1015 domain-containing protein [Clostridia bacterium]|nr:DUF1015 domain-containing protein [Clostridia bacterium]
MTYNTIFSPAEILLPKAQSASDWQKWAVIACDQFTSRMEYWNDCVSFIGGGKSAYDYILPEAYLGTGKEAEHGAEIARNMADFDPASMNVFDGIVYLERTLPDGSVRCGMVGKIDLEAYSYAADSHSPIRATEATILERIPPRQKIRAAAAIELPHILVLISDKPEDGIFASLDSAKGNLPVLYDFDLMLGGGHICGYGVQGDALAALMEKLAAYEAKNAGGVVYAMGDGNHSLASAKAHYEAVRAEIGAEAAKDHPARYALCEITALEDESLVFEPIYRIIMDCDTADVMAELEKVTEPGEGGQQVTVCIGGREEVRHFTTPAHALVVGTLQNFVDGYVQSHAGAVCDYIHGEEDLRGLAKEDRRVGFLFDSLAKADLFGYVDKYGTTPRKTFSMGEARSKRYYLEARKIRK